MQEEKKLTKTSREMVVEILTKVSPDVDFTDDSVLFDRILDDYNSYADLINRHHDEVDKARREGEIAGRNAGIEQLIAREDSGDGIPHLGGTNIAANNRQTSIFDIALRGM